MKLFSNEIERNAKTKLSFALCTALALSGAALCADEKDNAGKPDSSAAEQAGKASNLSRSDQSFIKDAAKGGMMEVQMGQLGVQKAQSDQLKQYAQRLVDDHTKANAELQQIASSKGVTLPSAQDSLSNTTDTSERAKVRDRADAEHKEHGAMKKLEGLSGAEFDREFVRMAIKDHEKDVKEFERASKSLSDTELKAFAAKTLPKLQEHLSQAKSLQTSIGSTGAPGTDSGADAGKVKSDSDSSTK